VSIEDRRVDELIRSAREHLAGYLLSPYHRQPHITLCVCGFPAERRNYDDDYPDELFRQHQEMLRQAATGPFTVEIGGMKSFASAPFLEIRDDGGNLVQLRDMLLGKDREIGRDRFVPHVTVGLYRDAFPKEVVLRKLASFTDRRCMLEVDRITFATYEASDMNGRLTYLLDIPLRTAG
jgi:2'-5' RNA ligase